MTSPITLPGSTPVEVTKLSTGKKSDNTFEAFNVYVSLESIGPAILRRIFDYGLKQVVNDTVSQISTDDRESVIAAIEERFQAWYSGEWSAKRTGRGPAEVTVESIARDMAKVALTAALKARDGKDAKLDLRGNDAHKAAVAKYAAKPEVVAAAEKRLAEMRAAAEAGDVLGDLGL